MSKKRLDEQKVFNELKGSSAFFPDKRETPLPDSPEKHGPMPSVIGLEGPKRVQKDISSLSEGESRQGTSGKVPGAKIREGKKNDDTAIPRHHDTMVSAYPDTVIETIRKAVKQQGKEAATHRFTLEEKKLLRDAVYTYVAQGIRTSENEIARIAIHYLIADYHENNQMSVLAQVLERLNS